MRAVALVFLAPEHSLPPGVVKSLPLVERHPVLDFGGIFLLALAALQGSGTLFEGEREDSGGSSLIQRDITCDDIALEEKSSVQVIPHVLGPDADFDVGPVQIVHAVPAEVAGIAPIVVAQINRLPLHGLARENVL